MSILSPNVADFGMADFAPSREVLLRKAAGAFLGIDMLPVMDLEISDGWWKHGGCTHFLEIDIFMIVDVVLEIYIYI